MSTTYNTAMYAKPRPVSSHYLTRLSALLTVLCSLVGCILPHANPMRDDRPAVGMDVDVVVVDVPSMDADAERDVMDVPNPCPMNRTRCGADCVDLGNSPIHCGACGTMCTPGSNQTASCQLGMCANICQMGFLDCNMMGPDGCEVNGQTDNMNCGGCNNRCAANSVCRNGRCECAMGFTMCGGTCLNLQTNVNNCGACGTMCPARPNSSVTCAAGACVYTCLATHADCNMDLNGMAPGNGCEVVLGTAQNCRMCGETCSGMTPNCVRAMGCVNGCAPLSNCSNMCVDTQLNPLHCGGCGRACAATNAIPGCTAGVCTPTCNAGFGNCDMNGMNGCEVNLQNDNNNCGACGNRCGANSTCSNGTCRCNANFGDCNNMLADGCEARLDTTTNCNACGVVCGPYGNASATCTGAVGMMTCGLSCNANFQNCDGMLANGCEVDTRTNLNHCGMCGRPCMAANATSECNNGSCRIAMNGCAANFGDCDNSYANGCETNVTMNVTHCGTCGNACPARANATPTCTASSCGFSCTMGFGNCDLMAANGCEVNLSNTVANCGMCGMMCPAPANATAACSNGMCGLGMCSAGFGNCDMNAANGCELPLTSNANCGACGTMCMTAVAYCNAAMTCVGCPGGTRDCNNNPADMCEVNITNDVLNCNACGRACTNPHGSTVCTANACVPTCDAGYANCDGNAQNGCEADLSTAATCGSCGVTCMAPNPNCVAGLCAP